LASCLSPLRKNRASFPRCKLFNIGREAQKHPMIQIREATSLGAIEVVRELFREYGDLPEVDIARHESAGLPGKYAPPTGALLVALDGAAGAGCVALRKLDGQTCEMKRLYVRPKYRGERIGRMLVLEIIARARALGYAKMRLDTRAWMQSAQALYRSLGFREIPPYLSETVFGTLYFELDLSGIALAARQAGFCG
jgi:putative acetyltransferase